VQAHNSRCQRQNLQSPSLEDFVLSNDEHLYDKDVGLVRLIGQAQLRLLNSSTSLEQLHTALESLNLTNEQRLRPSWDQYFMQLANLAAQRCNCMKRRVGCVLVRDKRVISTGYNGTPRNLRNCNEGGCKLQPSPHWTSKRGLTWLGARCNNGQGSGVSLSTCLCLHAEENALLEAGRDRIGEGSVLYCDT
jgi:dCMP deaminase